MDKLIKIVQYTSGIKNQKKKSVQNYKKKEKNKKTTTIMIWASSHTSANPDFGYVTLCDTTDSMILWTYIRKIQYSLSGLI